MPCRSPSCRIASTSLSCLRAHVRPGVPCRSPPVTTQRTVSRYNSYRASCAPCRSANAAVSSAVSRAVSRPKRLPPTMIQFLYRDSPLARPCARTRCLTPRVQADLIMVVCWPYRRHARPCRGRDLPSHACPCAPCVMIQSTVS